MLFFVFSGSSYKSNLFQNQIYKNLAKPIDRPDSLTPFLESKTNQNRHGGVDNNLKKTIPCQDGKISSRERLVNGIGAGSFGYGQVRTETSKNAENRTETDMDHVAQNTRQTI